MAVKGWAVGLPAAALVGTNKLPWEALGNVRELYLCLDLDVTGEGQKAARKLAREAVLRGVPVHIMWTAPRITKPTARGFDHIGLTPAAITRTSISF